MRITIDNTIIEESGLTLEEFLLILLVGNDIDVFKAITTLKEKGLVLPKAKPPYNIRLTKDACSLYEDIVLKTSEILDNPARYEELAKKLIDIYPKGFKDGTYSWVEGPLLVAKRLQVFEIKYGKYSDEDIIDAAQKYVNIMYGKPEMRLLKYFIFKEKTTNAGEQESSSDLYNMLVNKEDTLFEAEEWKNEI